MNKKKKNKRRFIKTISEHIKLILGIIAVVILLFPFATCIILKILTANIPGEIFVVTNEIDSWFSFWASYSGVIASSVIGIITLYLSLVLDEINTENSERQNRMSIATNMPNMSCDNMSLYSLSEADFPREYLREFKERRNHILVFEMTPAFPPYFKIEIKSIKIILKDLQSGLAMDDVSMILEEKDYVISNNNKFRAVINIPNKMNESMQNLYYLSLVTTEGTDYEAKIGDMWIQFQCSNVLLEENHGNVLFNIHFEVENTGNKDEYGRGIQLQIINRQFERIE